MVYGHCPVSCCLPDVRASWPWASRPGLHGLASSLVTRERPLQWRLPGIKAYLVLRLGRYYVRVRLVVLLLVQGDDFAQALGDGIDLVQGADFGC